jgi:23S rRNA pseudouridine1911/1915/1917 synthase
MKRAEARVQDPSHAGVRVDVFLSEVMGLFSRSQVRSRVVEVRVNGATARLSRKLKAGDAVAVDFNDPPPLNAQPEDIPLAILFENQDVIVLDKPQGMVVHPGSGNHRGTLVNALLHHCAGLESRFGPGDPRPGIVHRLDKETSGVIIAAKNPEAHAYLAAQFKSRGTRKRYLAVLAGCPRPLSGTVETRISRDPRHRILFAVTRTGGKPAVTRYAVLRSYTRPGSAAGAAPAYCLVSLGPRTGRTHQLRVHMRSLKTPILGDPLYGRKDPLFPAATLMLHAHRLTITLPGETEARTFTAPLPQRFRKVLRSLQSPSARGAL